MKNFRRIFWGIVLIALGVIFGINALGIADINVFFRGWWTLFIIIPCAVGIFTSADKIGNAVGFIFGVLLLLCVRDVLSFGVLLKLIIPVAVVIFGVKLILGGIFGNKNADAYKRIAQSSQTKKNCTATFAGADINFDNEVFENAELNAIFGGVTCDLRRAIIEKDCVISATAVFGGIDIFVPENINVAVNSTAIFGGTDAKDHRNTDDDVPTLYVNSTCLFGGVDIK